MITRTATGFLALLIALGATTAMASSRCRQISEARHIRWQIEYAEEQIPTEPGVAAHVSSSVRNTPSIDQPYFPAPHFITCPSQRPPPNFLS